MGNGMEAVTGRLRNKGNTGEEWDECMQSGISMHVPPQLGGGDRDFSMSSPPPHVLLPKKHQQPLDEMVLPKARDSSRIQSGRSEETAALHPGLSGHR